MSEEEKFSQIIQEIKDIFLFLTKGEPSPDDEIEARVSLIEKITDMKNVNTFQVEENLNLIEETLKKLEKWDTLDLWFIESEVPDSIKRIISITNQIPEAEEMEKIEEISSEEAQKDLNSLQVDIKEIVDQVSDKFKGEIDDLKQKIEFLKHEIDEKDETLKQVTHKKVVKKIKPKRESILPPPKIKIPIIKKPETPPHVIAPAKLEKEINKTEDQIPKKNYGINSIEHVQSKIEEEIEKLKPIPPLREETEE
ncbi:MAG: hypothetical protein ACW99L_04990, partial [Promethearchaeota archaeon]